MRCHSLRFTFYVFSMVQNEFAGGKTASVNTDGENDRMFED